MCLLILEKIKCLYVQKNWNEFCACKIVFFRVRNLFGSLRNARQASYKNSVTGRVTSWSEHDRRFSVIRSLSSAPGNEAVGSSLLLNVTVAQRRDIFCRWLAGTLHSIYWSVGNRSIYVSMKIHVGSFVLQVNSKAAWSTIEHRATKRRPLLKQCCWSGSIAIGGCIFYL